MDQLARLHPIELGKLTFVGDALRTLRAEVGGAAAVLGFVGSPWTLATYLVEVSCGVGVGVGVGWGGLG
jgi:uroporphyrinogen decarboxylase